MKTCFIGHRNVFVNNIRERIEEAILVEMANGCRTFTMGTHGDFDSLALAACRHLRRTHKEIDIEVVITSLKTFAKSTNEYKDNPYHDVKTVMYVIKEAHFKQQITLSNRKMIDECDTLICYVDENESRSGAKTAMRYAKKHGLKIVNLYREEDHPFYGMTKEEIDKLWNSLCEKVFSKKEKK